MTISPREKKVLIVGAIAIIVILLYRYVLTPFFYQCTQIEEETTSQLLLLEKNQFRVARKDKLARKKEAQEKELAQQQKRLLPGEKPPIAAAELQKILKKIIKKNKAVTRSEKILPVETAGTFQKISVEITIRCLVTHLKDILYQVENHQLLLTIPQISIKLTNRRHPKDVEARLIVAGLIRQLEQPGNVQKTNLP